MSVDIQNAIDRFTATFKALGMKPPSTIILDSHEDGMRFINELTLPITTNIYTIDLEGDGPFKVRMVAKEPDTNQHRLYVGMKFMGVKILWPIK